MDKFEYSIIYKLESLLGDEDLDRYINCYDADIMVLKASGEKLKVGRLVFDIVNVNKAQEEGVSLRSLFNDYDSSLAYFAKQFIDFKVDDFN